MSSPRNRFPSLKGIVSLLLFLSFLGSSILLAQDQERFFDTLDLDRERVIIAIFYSHPGSWETLAKLNELIEVLALEKMAVVYVYHQKEIIDYQKAIDFVKENKIDWIKFHRISVPFDRRDLFKKSAISDEFEKIFKSSDGVIFFGGYDIPAYVYKKKTSLRAEIITPYRHFIEVSAAYHLLGGFQDKRYKGFLDSQPEFPVLGICLGCQTLNVGAGGTLIQDIWSETYEKKCIEDVFKIPKQNLHRNPFAFLYPEEKFSFYTLHPIKLERKRKFCTELGFSPEDIPLVLSGHHQAISKLGMGLRVIATSLDGKVVEAVEHDKFPNVLGIQFHPDHPLLYNPQEKFKFTPNDREEKSPISILRENPPSLEFNLKIWSWFKERLIDYHIKRQQ